MEKKEEIVKKMIEIQKDIIEQETKFKLLKDEIDKILQELKEY